MFVTHSKTVNDPSETPVARARGSVLGKGAHSGSGPEVPPRLKRDGGAAARRAPPPGPGGLRHLGAARQSPLPGIDVVNSELSYAKSPEMIAFRAAPRAN